MASNELEMDTVIIGNKPVGEYLEPIFQRLKRLKRARVKAVGKKLYKLDTILSYFSITNIKECGRECEQYKDSDLESVCVTLVVPENGSGAAKN